MRSPSQSPSTATGTGHAPMSVSFEFFPPADAAMEQMLWQSVQRLAPLGPRFVSVTYGADGSTRERTHSLVARVQRETSLRGAPHLTCIGATRGEILEIARTYWDQGIRHLFDIGHHRLQRERLPLFMLLAQRAIGRVIHRQKGHAILHSKIQHAHNMRMRQLSDSLRLALKACNIRVR